MAELGCRAGWQEVAAAVTRNFGRVFEREMVSAALEMEKAI
jgi:hypothetical protein